MTEENLRKVQQYLSLSLLDGFFFGILVYLMHQEFFRPIANESALNIFSVGVFLLFVFLILLISIKILQEAIYDISLYRNKNKPEVLLKNKFLTPRIALIVTIFIDLLIGLKIFGVLDIFVLISTLVLFVLIIWLIK